MNNDRLPGELSPISLSPRFFEPAAFRRIDETPDAQFYGQPRFVTHIDDAAIAAVTDVYRTWLRPEGRLLDLMTSWVSHLPPEINFPYVFGLGMNEPELKANRRLNGYCLHDLNADPCLPFETDSFDQATLCVSIDYLTRPLEMLRDLARVLTPGSPLVITFSNRCFPTKAVGVWLALSPEQRVSWVGELLRRAGGWEAVRLFDLSPRALGLPMPTDPLYAVVGRTVREKMP